MGKQFKISKSVDSEITDPFMRSAKIFPETEVNPEPSLISKKFWAKIAIMNEESASFPLNYNN